MIFERRERSVDGNFSPDCVPANVSRNVGNTWLIDKALWAELDLVQYAHSGKNSDSIVKL